MSSIIWQPKNLHSWPSIDIEVSNEFAKQAYNFHLTPEGSRKINDEARKFLVNQFGNMAAHSPIEFYENTYLAQNFHLTGLKSYFGNIPLDVFGIDNGRQENLSFKGKNIDMTACTMAVLKLLDFWTSNYGFHRDKYEQR